MNKFFHHSNHTFDFEKIGFVVFLVSFVGFLLAFVAVEFDGISTAEVVALAGVEASRALRVIGFCAVSLALACVIERVSGHFLQD